MSPCKTSSSNHERDVYAHRGACHLSLCHHFEAYCRFYSLMNKAPVVVTCVALRAPVAYAPGASQHTGAVQVTTRWAVCSERELVRVACARMCSDQFEISSNESR